MTERSELSEVQKKTINNFLELNDPLKEEVVYAFVQGLMALRRIEQPNKSA